MIFAAGMGIGLTFWSVTEPLIHFVDPPIPLASYYEKKRLAFQIFFMHWGFSVWSIYAVIGVVFSYFRYEYHYNKISEIISHSLRCHSFLFGLIDAFVIWAGLLGIVTTLGLGALQISSGVCSLAGIANSRAVSITIIAVLTVCFMLSCISGVRHGIKYLSLINMILMLFIITFFLLFGGPLGYILNTFFCAITDYLLDGLSLFIPKSQYSLEWTGRWTVFYWATWISWSPIVGSFIARISRGRRIRELILSVIFLPSLFSFIFVSAVGGTAFYSELTKVTSICNVVVKNTNFVWFELLACMPFIQFATLISCVLMMIFFITSADSGIFALCQLVGDSKANIAHNRKDLVIIFGLLISAITALLTYINGLEALKTAALFGSLPFIPIIILLIVTLLKELISNKHTTIEKIG